MPDPTCRPKNLLPLKKQLEAAGFDVQLEEIEEKDAIEIFMDGKSVLKGDVKGYNRWSASNTTKTVEQLKEMIVTKEDKLTLEKGEEEEKGKEDPKKGEAT